MFYKLLTLNLLMCVNLLFGAAAAVDINPKDYISDISQDDFRNFEKCFICLKQKDEVADINELSRFNCRSNVPHIICTDCAIAWIGNGQHLTCPLCKSELRQDISLICKQDYEIIKRFIDKNLSIEDKPNFMYTIYCEKDCNQSILNALLNKSIKKNIF